MVQKWPFKDLFWDLRLGDTVIEATRSHRQIEAMALVLWCIKKLTRSLQERPLWGRFLTPPRLKIQIFVILRGDSA